MVLLQLVQPRTLVRKLLSCVNGIATATAGSPVLLDLCPAALDTAACQVIVVGESLVFTYFNVSKHFSILHRKHV